MILHIAKMKSGVMLLRWLTARMYIWINIDKKIKWNHIPSLLIIGIFSDGMNCAQPHIMVWVKKRVYVAYIPWDRLLDFVTG
jgi:hypothetical protein